METLFKTEEGKKAVLEVYQKKLKDLAISYETQEVNTTFGETNIIVTGNPANPPLVLVHGANGCAPIALDVYPNLAKAYRVYAIDVVGEPNLSAGRQMNKKANEHGKWLVEVLVKLDLKEVILAGFSLGGLVIWQTLIEDETNIKAAYLIVPAGIVNGNPLKALFKIFIPMKRYMSTQKGKHLDRFLDGMFSEKDEFAHAFLSKVLLHFNMDFSPIPTIKERDAKKITTPLTIIAAKNDLFFPGEKLLKRAKKVFPSLRETILLEHSKHVQSTANNLKVEQLILNESHKT